MFEADNDLTYRLLNPLAEATDPVGKLVKIVRLHEVFFQLELDVLADSSSRLPIGSLGGVGSFVSADRRPTYRSASGTYLLGKQDVPPAPP